MEIDVRNTTKEDIDIIRFTSHPQYDFAVAADTLVLSAGDCPVWLQNSKNDSDIIGVRNKEDALNLIEALKKAIELGWFE